MKHNTSTIGKGTIKTETVAPFCSKNDSGISFYYNLTTIKANLSFTKAKVNFMKLNLNFREERVIMTDFLVMLLSHPTTHDVPINDVPKSINMVGTAVLIVEVIGVFPDIES